MLLEKLKKYLVLFTMIFASGLQFGCSENQDGASEDGVTISGTISDNSSSALAKLGSQKVSHYSVTDYELYCVTFESEPHSAVSPLSAEGVFSLTMPAGVPFGCFINHAESQIPVATIAIVGDSSSFGESSSAALQFTRDVDFGNLVLDLASAQILVPRDRVEDVIVDQPELRLDPAEIANRSYLMNCLPSGNAWLDQACQDDIASDDGDNEVFFRIMQGSRNQEEVYGIGVWESEQAFQDCGGIDLTDDMVSDLNADEGIVFDPAGILSGPSFSSGALCPLRDGAAPATHENLENYYAAGELIADGQGWTLYARDTRLANAGCEIENTTVVHFTGESAERMIGQFMTHETVRDLDNGGGDCSHLTQRPPTSFSIEFVQQ